MVTQTYKFLFWHGHSNLQKYFFEISYTQHYNSLFWHCLFFDMTFHPNVLNFSLTCSSKNPPSLTGKQIMWSLSSWTFSFPRGSPYIPKRKMVSAKNGPRKIKTYIEKHFNGSKVQINDVYKPNGIKSEQSAAEDIFDLMMISAPPCTLPGSPERLQYLRHFYPTLPLACIDVQELKTVDVSILNAPMPQPTYRQTYHFNQLAVTWFQTHQMLWQTITYQSSIASPGLLMKSRRSHSSGLIHLNFWQSRPNPWISSLWVWETISTNKKMFQKERIPLFVDSSECYFQIFLVKIETKHKSISNASLCWTILRTFSWRYASYSSAHSWKRRYCHHDSNFQSSKDGWMIYSELCLNHRERIPASV